MNERKIGIAVSYLNIGLQAVIGFLYVPLLLYYIGQSEYGLYQLIGSLIAYFSIMDFGLTNAVVRFYARYRALQNEKAMENILAVAVGTCAGCRLSLLPQSGVDIFQQYGRGGDRGRAGYIRLAPVQYRLHTADHGLSGGDQCA